MIDVDLMRSKVELGEGILAVARMAHHALDEVEKLQAALEQCAENHAEIAAAHAPKCNCNDCATYIIARRALL